MGDSHAAFSMELLDPPHGSVMRSPTTPCALAPFCSEGSLLIGAQAESANDTWEWNGEFWTQMADIGPTARQDHALCFDTVHQTTLLFGGLSGQNTPAQTLALARRWSRPTCK
jgi:hypothetical protein